jgi:hypothetical protein
MSNSEAALEALVDNWLTDVRRRGAELYAMNKGNKILYLSFEGKRELRFSVNIDFAVKDVRVQITGPKWNFVERNAFLLNAENLRSLAHRMCPVKEGQAVIPIYLLVRLMILCHAYQRLVEDYEREYQMHTSTKTLQKLESEVRQYLTPEEQKRTDNPILQARRGARSSPSLPSVRNISLCDTQERGKFDRLLLTD